jgi:hypothetical protein
MKVLVLALLTVVSVRSADAHMVRPPGPPHPPPPPTDRCEAIGTPMFEIDHRAFDGAHVPTSTLKLYRSGAWTLFSTTAGGKRGSSASGCLDRNVVAQIGRDLKSSQWSVHYQRIRCMAMTASYTVYSAFGRAVYTEKMCGGAVLDSKSRRNLNEIESLLVPSADSYAEPPTDDDHFAKPPSKR